ncbi:unnamed protein product [Effrenium voratum]|uniref:Uncharacterized protein n=1 Tax=Effrenium voratum TaxID=2562239 RepID=A0AA36IGL1_9DINO|nr:unnamed protein product [Effrenium voratum]CAJ1386903.1 unnamed protein product [Effrenium voratum]CAJ1417973.1 unnamed protein product [Effrenium voratum]
MAAKAASEMLAPVDLPPVKLGVKQDFRSIAGMGVNFPGGDVMYQSLWRKNGGDLNLWPKEERYYKGPRLGEYARPIIMNRNVLGYLNQAPVPLSAAEDELSLVAEASGGARRAKAHALYAQQAAEKARAFYKLAKARARALFLPDPPISVKPTADVYPMYSAGPTRLMEFQALALVPRREAESARHATSASLALQFL